MTIIPRHMPHNNSSSIFILSGSMNFEVTNGGEICSDIGKKSIPDQEICKNAAKQLGKTFNEEILNESGLPTGCFYIKNVLVGWNIYEIESEIFGDIGEICLGGGK